MNYKFGIVLEEANDYLRKYELNFFGLKKEEYKIQFDEKGRAFILEDVNMRRTEKVLEILEQQDVKARYESITRWKELPELE